MMKLIIDSGASFHVHNHIEDLTNVRLCSAKIIGIDHDPHEIKSIGDLPVKAIDSLGIEYELLIKNVRHAPRFKDTLISVGQLWEEGQVDAVFKDKCYITTPCKKSFPFKKSKGAGLYTWHVKHNTSYKPSASSPSTPKKKVTFDQALSFQPTHSSKTSSHIARLHPDTAAKYMHRRLHVGARRMNLLPELTADAPSKAILSELVWVPVRIV